MFTFRYDRDDFAPIDPRSYTRGRTLNVHMGHMKLDEFKHS